MTWLHEIAQKYNSGVLLFRRYIVDMANEQFLFGSRKFLLCAICSNHFVKLCSIHAHVFVRKQTCNSLSRVVYRYTALLLNFD